MPYFLLFSLLFFIAGPVMADPLRFVASPLPPLEINLDGKPDGATLVVLRELSEKMGNPYSVEFLPFPRALAVSQSSPNVAFAGAARIAERESLYKWVGPLVYDSIVLVTKKGAKAAPATLEAAKGWRIGALRGGQTEVALRNAGLTNIEEQKDWDIGAKMLEAGRVDAWAVSRLGGPYIYHSLGFDTKTLEIGPEVCRNDLYLAVSKNVPDETIAAWQKAVDEMKARGRIAEITKQFSQ
jgi:polar amino acid transport system substrate-binding protein